MADPRRINVVNEKTGEKRSIPVDAFEQYKKEGYVGGWREETPEEYKAGSEARRYEDKGAAAFTYGLLDGASLGGFSAFMGAVDPEAREEIRGTKEKNPWSNALGNVGGSFLIPGGAVGKVGAMAERAAISVAPKFRALGTVARTAAEGATFGAGGSVERLGLSDEPVTGERLASELGSGLVHGGLAGLGLGVIGAGIVGATRAVRGMAKAKVAEMTAPPSIGEGVIKEAEAAGIAPAPAMSAEEAAARARTTREIPPDAQAVAGEISAPGSPRRPTAEVTPSQIIGEEAVPSVSWRDPELPRGDLKKAKYDHDAYIAELNRRIDAGELPRQEIAPAPDFWLDANKELRAARESGDAQRIAAAEKGVADAGAKWDRLHKRAEAGGGTRTLGSREAKTELPKSYEPSTEAVTSPGRVRPSRTEAPAETPSSEAVTGSLSAPSRSPKGATSVSQAEIPPTVKGQLDQARIDIDEIVHNYHVQRRGFANHYAEGLIPKEVAEAEIAKLDAGFARYQQEFAGSRDAGLSLRDINNRHGGIVEPENINLEHYTAKPPQKYIRGRQNYSLDASDPELLDIILNQPGRLAVANEFRDVVTAGRDFMRSYKGMPKRVNFPILDKGNLTGRFEGFKTPGAGAPVPGPANLETAAARGAAAESRVAAAAPAAAAPVEYEQAIFARPVGGGPAVEVGRFPNVLEASEGLKKLDRKKWVLQGENGPELKRVPKIVPGSKAEIETAPTVLAPPAATPGLKPEAKLPPGVGPAKLPSSPPPAAAPKQAAGPAPKLKQEAASGGNGDPFLRRLMGWAGGGALGGAGWSAGGPIGGAIGYPLGRQGGRALYDMFAGKLGESSAKLGAASATARQRIADGLERVIKAGPTLRRVGVPAAVYALNTASFGDSKAKPKNTLEAFKLRQAELSRIAADPLAERRRVHEILTGLRALAPAAADAAEEAIMRRTAFLTAKMPKNPGMARMGVPLDNWRPSEGQLVEWSRYVAAAEDPVGRTLAEMEAGSLTPQTVETVRVVYPQLYAEMKRDFIEKVVSGEMKDWPRGLRTQVSIFFGVPSSTFDAPDMVQTLQKNFATEKGSDGGTRAPVAQLGSAKNSEELTPAQRLASEG